MAELLEIPATVTERGQTTVPAPIRRMLALRKRDQVVFRALADGTVVIARALARPAEEDPVLAGFLAFLARDMGATPSRIQPVPSSLIARARLLVDGVDVDCDGPLPDDGG